MRKNEEEREGGAEKKRVSSREWEEESALSARVARKGVSGNLKYARERVSAGRLAEGGELTTKEEYHRSYGEVKRKERGRLQRSEGRRVETARSG